MPLMSQVVDATDGKESDKELTMIESALEIREVREPDGDGETRYEVYDSDTGMPVGVFDSYEDAKYEVESMKQSNRETWNKESDADPGPE